VCHNQQARESQTPALASTSNQDCIHLRNFKDSPLAVYLPGSQNIIAQFSRETHIPNTNRNPRQRCSPNRGKIWEESNRPICQQRQSPTPAILPSECGPNALAIDACQQKWPDKAYAFPPWILINRVLAKIQQQPIRHSLGNSNMDNNNCGGQN
jgi:hypothetical protein